MKKMKIGIFCPYNYFRHGGVQETIIAHQELLTQLGHEVTVITPKPMKEYLDRIGKYVYLGRSKEFDKLFDTKADVSKVTSEELRTFLDEHKFDIIQIHEPGVPYVGKKLLKASNVPVLGTFHARLPNNIFTNTFSYLVLRPYTRSIMKKLSAANAASQTAAFQIEKLTGRKLEIIPIGVDVDKYSKQFKKPRSKKKTILFVGRLEGRKGIDLLLKAFERLRKERDDIELLIAGDGEMRQELEDYVRTHLVDDVEFLGFVEESEKIELLNTSDLYCAPSPYGEGFGIVLIEAMSAGIPYLGGDNEGYRATSADMADELLIDPTNIENFTVKLESMLFDEAFVKRYKKWAKKYVKQFDYKGIVKRYEKLYKEILKGR